MAILNLILELFFNFVFTLSIKIITIIIVILHYYSNIFNSPR